MHITSDRTFFFSFSISISYKLTINKLLQNKVVDLLNGKFDCQIDEYIIIDSRYPYEFDGGHIQNAYNIYTKDKLIEEIFIKRLNFKKDPRLSCNKVCCVNDFKTTEIRNALSTKRTIVIFHCEFSSERGPSL